MPSPVNDPLILLPTRADRQPTFLNKVYNTAACTAAGFGLAMILNWPIFSGIQTHFALAAVGGFAGVYIEKKRVEVLATRDAILMLRSDGLIKSTLSGFSAEIY